jgi:hypothetical protein
VGGKNLRYSLEFLVGHFLHLFLVYPVEYKEMMRQEHRFVRKHEIKEKNELIPALDCIILYTFRYQY